MQNLHSFLIFFVNDLSTANSTSQCIVLYCKSLIPAPMYSINLGQSGCSVCQQDTYSNETQKTCKQCETGYSTKGLVGQAECTKGESMYTYHLFLEILRLRLNSVYLLQITFEEYV